MLQAGAFRDRVEEQTRTSDDATFGSDAEDWATTATHWCRRVPISVQYAMVLAQRGHTRRIEKLVFRGEKSVDIANTRWLLDGRYYRAIEPPDVDSRKRTTSVLVSQEVQR